MTDIIIRTAQYRPTVGESELFLRVAEGVRRIAPEATAAQTIENSKRFLFHSGGGFFQRLGDAIMCEQLAQHLVKQVMVASFVLMLEKGNFAIDDIASELRTEFAAMELDVRICAFHTDKLSLQQLRIFSTDSTLRLANIELAFVRSESARRLILDGMSIRHLLIHLEV